MLASAAVRTSAVAALLIAVSGLLGCNSRVFAPAAEARERPGEVVVLLHGLGRSARAMYGLGQWLSEQGYRAEAWDYDTVGRPIQQSAQWFEKELQRLEQDDDVQRYHIVTHSLGGIVTRKMLLQSRPRKLGKVVMLAPPNQGSPWGRRLGWLLRPISPSLYQLSDRPGSYVTRMEAPQGVPIGIIAAEEDGKVPVDSTHLATESDHVIVDGGHTWIMNRPDTRRHILTFLQHGSFQPEATVAE
jgi:hypothetical protein